jgi:hypothetical protein
VVVSPYVGFSGAGIVNPYAVPWLEWAARPVDVLVVQAWPAVIVGLAVLASRALFGPVEVRRRTRVMALTVAGAVVAFVLWGALPALPGVELLVYASLIALPVAAIHGIFRYGAFDIAPDDRGRTVARSSALLITVFYAIAVATPAVLLSGVLAVVPAVLITAVVAVALLPARAWLQRAIERALFGDRDRQFSMLSALGAQLEQTVEPAVLLTRLAAAVRDGLDASWVRIRLLDADGELGESPVGTAGEVGADAGTAGTAGAAAEPVPSETSALVLGDESLGRIDVGPRRRGEYGDAERAVLRTVAGQAAAAVANVRLSAQLAQQLEELTA